MQMTTPERKKRPQLERDRPIRSWSTLFGANGERKPPGTEPAPGDQRGGPIDIGRAMTESVGIGYRVIDEYVRQGQQVARAFNPGSSAPRGPVPDDISQMSQKLMQYGWDFAGLWFEMWTKMAASGAVMPPPFMPQPPPGTAHAHGAPATSNGATGDDTTSNGATSNGVATNAARERIVVSVSCQRPTTTALEVRPGAGSNLVVHSLRAEGHEAPPIRDITLERAEDGTLTVRVVIGAEQPPGIYNAMILDSSNLPRGTLSVVIAGDAGGHSA